MKKLMKKKVNVFGKKLPVFMIALLGIAVVSAALITSWGTITGLVTVSQGFSFNGMDWDATPITQTWDSFTSLEEKTLSSGPYYLENTATVDAEFGLTTTCTYKENAGDTAVACDSDVSPEVEYLLDNLNGVCGSGDPTCEKRITILASDVGVATLDQLSTISWDAEVISGYLPHVDVLIDTTGNGIADDALVFEYAKVATPFDDITSYPTAGTYNTFGDKLAISDTSIAWLTTEDSGPVTGVNYTAYTLADWKTGKTSNKNSKIIPANVTVIRFEFEVDNWMKTITGNPFNGIDANSTVSGIKINAAEPEVSGLKANSRLDFQIVTDFPKMLIPAEYNITTTVTA